MSSSGSGKQTRVQRLQPTTESEKRKDGPERAPEISSDVELTADLAQQLQPQLGNEALQLLMATEGNESLSAQNAQEQEESNAQHDVVQEEEQGTDQKLEVPSFGGAPSSPSTPGDVPWNADLIFSGEDEPDDHTPRSRPRPRRRRRQLQNQEDLFQEAHENNDAPFQNTHIGAIKERLSPTRAPSLVDRSGDACYQAIESTLNRPAALARPEWSPEDLARHRDVHEPLIVGSEIGRFLGTNAQHLRSRSIARVLSSGLSTLIPCPPGYASGVARVAHLSVCAQAVEGGREATDRSVSIALEWDSWSDAVESAKVLAKQGRLHALDIFRQTLSPREPAEQPQAPGNNSQSYLTQAALLHVLPHGFMPEIPDLVFRSPEDLPEETDLAALDAILTQFSIGEKDAPSDSTTRLQAPAVQPALNATRHLLNAIGRTQVEAAAAALAVVRVHPSAPVSVTLVTVDRGLRKLARSTVQCGSQLSALVGSPLPIAREKGQPLIDSLRQALGSLSLLQTWTLSQLSNAVIQ